MAAVILWKCGRRVVQGFKWAHAWAVRNEQTGLKVMALSTQMERVIGTNGGSTIFDRFDAMDDRLLQIGSIAEGMKEPSILFGPNGQVISVNYAFRRATGWAEEDLSRGGWRSKMTEADQDEWDDAVAQQGIFERKLHLYGLPVALVAQIRPILGKRFVGWRGIFEVQKP